MNTFLKWTSLTTRLKVSKVPLYMRVQHFKRNFRPIMRELRSRKDRFPQITTPRNTFSEWNYEAELYAFGKRLQEDFNEDLLRRALTERSYVVHLEEEQKQVGIEPSPDDRFDNAEMVQDGEQFLTDFVVLYLRQVLSRYPEEGIQSITKFLTSEEVLSDISFHIGTSDIILSSEYPVQKPALVSVFKAIVSALKESSGEKRASIFVRDFVISQLAQRNINDLWLIQNPISALNTICSNSGEKEPEPRLVGEAGKKTILACYRVGLYLNKKLIGLSPGETVEIAHEMAANDALWRLFGTAEHQLMIPFDLDIDPNSENEPNISLNEWSEKKVEDRLKRLKSDENIEVVHG